MSPPCYADLGKSAKDIFSKNYRKFLPPDRGRKFGLICLCYGLKFNLISITDLGLVKLDVKTKTANNVEFSLAGTSINDTGRVNASFETKYFFRDIGATIKEKWTTDNTILSEIAFENQLIKGSKLTLNANIAPQSGKKSAAVKGVLKGECYHANADFDFDSLNNGTLCNGSIVLGYVLQQSVFILFAL